MYALAQIAPAEHEVVVAFYLAATGPVHAQSLVLIHANSCHGMTCSHTSQAKDDKLRACNDLFDLPLVLAFAGIEDCYATIFAAIDLTAPHDIAKHPFEVVDLQPRSKMLSAFWCLNPE